MRRPAVVVMAGLAAAAAAALAWRRRRPARPAPPAVQLGLADGSVRRLGTDEAGAGTLRVRATELRAALEGDA